MSLAEQYMNLIDKRLTAAINKRLNEIDKIDLLLDKVRARLTDQDGEEIDEILKQRCEEIKDE